MASQFESFVDPLIIFFSIPLLLIGVVWIYKLTNQSMTMFSAVGIVALVGVVVNNGIILVDYTNTLRARGFNVREACMEAGRSRLRPILMTSLTTILAMVPIAFFPGPGTETIQPIGRTFVGGLTVSSFMTLLVTPVMYSLLNSWHDRRKFRSMETERSLRTDVSSFNQNGTVHEQESIQIPESSNPEEWIIRPENGLTHPPREET
jgi:HAE1 family hydrophobic/amphiphilic exporter-1